MLSPLLMQNLASRGVRIAIICGFPCDGPFSLSRTEGGVIPHCDNIELRVASLMVVLQFS